MILVRSLPSHARGLKKPPYTRRGMWLTLRSALCPASADTLAAQAERWGDLESNGSLTLPFLFVPKFLSENLGHAL